MHQVVIRGGRALPGSGRSSESIGSFHSTKFCPPLDVGTSLPVCQPFQASPLGALGSFGTECLCPRYHIFKIKTNFRFLPQNSIILLSCFDPLQSIGRPSLCTADGQASLLNTKQLFGQRTHTKCSRLPETKTPFPTWVAWGFPSGLHCTSAPAPWEPSTLMAESHCETTRMLSYASGHLWVRLGEEVKVSSSKGHPECYGSATLRVTRLNTQPWAMGGMDPSAQVFVRAHREGGERNSSNSPIPNSGSHLNLRVQGEKIAAKLCNQIKRAASSIRGIILWPRFCYC